MTFIRRGLLAPVAILCSSAALMATGNQVTEPAVGESGAAEAVADEAAAHEQGRDLFSARCRTCHELETATVQRNSRNEWQEIVHRMVQYGAQITEPEGEMIAGYLASVYGPENGGAPQAESNAAQP